VAGTVASVAATVATAAVMVKATEAAATVSAASTAIGAAGSVAGQVMALAARSATGSAGEPQAAAVQQLAVAATTRAATASAATAEAGAAAPTAATTPVTTTAVATATAVNSPLRAASLPAAGIPGTAPRAPANANASAAPGDLPVEQFSPSAPAAAATAANAARRAANGLPGEVASSATLPHGTGPAAQASKPGLEAPDNRTVRNAEGGERPAYTPRINSYGYAEGDTYTYQVMDTWKDEVINRYTTAIEEVLPDGQMLANGQRMMMDAQGRLLKRANPDGSVSKFEPSQDLWWSNPKRGESRDLRFTETIQRANGRSSEIEWKGSTSVGKAQKIDTPAGEFEVLPIESSGWAYEVMVDGLRSTKWSRTVWYSTKLGHPVAIDIQDADRLGKLLKRERVELLHAQASRAATP
jgi:hypothetical protein